VPRIVLQCCFCSRRHEVPDSYEGPLGPTIFESGWDPTPGYVLCPRCKAEHDRERIRWYRHLAGVYDGGLTGGL